MPSITDLDEVVTALTAAHAAATEAYDTMPHSHRARNTMWTAIEAIAAELAAAQDELYAAHYAELAEQVAEESMVQAALAAAELAAEREQYIYEVRDNPELCAELRAEWAELDATRTES